MSGVQLGGDWVVVVLAAVAAMSIDRLQMTIARRRIPGFYQQVAGGGPGHADRGRRGGHPAGRRRPARRSPRTSSSCSPGSRFIGTLQDALLPRVLAHLTAKHADPRRCSTTAGIITGVSGGLTFADMMA